MGVQVVTGNTSEGRRPVNVLVFPCGTEIGLEIHRALSCSTRVRLFGASSVASNHGKYVYKNYFEGLPFVDAPDFIPTLNRLVAANEMDAIYPAHDSVVLRLAQAGQDLACRVIGSPRKTCEICRRKSVTYHELADAVPVPVQYKHESVAFPVFLKPDVGQGSKGTQVARSIDEIDAALKRDPSLLLLEYLPGPEYTVDCFTDRHGALRFAGTRERIRIMNGISVDTRQVRDDRSDDYARRINGALKFRGAWFFQVKGRADGELALLEAAPRVSGGMGLFRNMGVNLPLLGVFDALDYDIEILDQTFELEMDRALASRFLHNIHYDHVYLDFDDTLVFEGGVNPLVAAFIFQCRNRKIAVHLLSRHDGEIMPALHRHGLERLFDSITIVHPGDCKSEYILHRPAIFIDDSFAERKRVREALGIPVFGVDAMDGLLDWRN